MEKITQKPKKKVDPPKKPMSSFFLYREEYYDKVKEKSTASAQTDHIETQRSGLTHIRLSFSAIIF